ncbi:MAG: FAD/NAD(P)-binding protein [Pseudomonadales bacterium]|nr:FAD/NAD(P)-binding protein [Pseudomonadales bacterium]
MNKRITRRDFLNGMSIGIGGLALPNALLRAQQAEYYPPALTGLRGSHDGSFETAHALRDGSSPRAEPTGENYDLVVVGGGISGLAAAWFFRQSVGLDARILILDNHDDFGGHAKRNEFTYQGRKILVNGGTLNMEQPSHYSTVARSLLRELGIDIARYQEQTAEARDFHRNRGLDGATFFDRETFGEDRLVAKPGYLSWADFVRKTPLSEQAQRDITRLYESADLPDTMPGLSDEQKKMRLAQMSYRDYLLDLVGVHPDVIPFFQTRPHFTFYMGPEQVPALYAWQLEYPGFQGLKLRPSAAISALAHLGGPHHGREHEHEESSVYFPDGNATISRLLVRSLIPEALPGNTFEDAISARLDYSRLDRDGSASRIRLNSTVINVVHAGDPETAEHVEVSYVQAGRALKVNAAHCVLACWHTVIPHFCPELSPQQKEALAYGIKAPRVYTNVLLRDSRAFARLGVRSIDAPGSYHSSSSLQFPLSVGSYHGPRSANDPIVLRMHRAPCSPGRPRREQLLAGRLELLSTTFDTFETRIREQLDRMLGEGGFDAARDIAAITVNRWPHGNAYIYSTLSEPVHWALYPADDRPCVVARQPFGRLTFANSDAGANPFTDVAIDEAHRAVREILLKRLL